MFPFHWIFLSKGSSLAAVSTAFRQAKFAHLLLVRTLFTFSQALLLLLGYLIISFLWLVETKLRALRG